MKEEWPELNYEAYADTVKLVHLWTQIIGKIRLRKMPWLNHSWHVSLYVSPRRVHYRQYPRQTGAF